MLISKTKNSAVYNVHLRFKNTKVRPVKFEYKELIDREKAQFTIIPKGTDEQQAQMRSTITGLQIEANNNTSDPFIILAANGGEQNYEYEIRLEYLDKKKSKLTKLRLCDNDD